MAGRLERYWCGCWRKPLCGLLLALAIGLTAMAGSADSAAASEIPACKTDLSEYLEPLDVPGLAAAIVKDGRILCTAVAGMADIEEERPVAPDTLFLMASISKTVTATALMQLHEQGEFDLDDDINDYLPFEVRIPEAPDEPITFRQLLTHTASIRDNGVSINCSGWCDLVAREADSPISLAEFTRGYLTPGGAYYDEDDNFEPDPPGTTFDYSNMGFVLIGYLVEVISGTPFDAYTREHIFDPLDMDETSWRLAEIDEDKLAMPYGSGWFGFAPLGQYGEPNYPDGMLRASVVELAHLLIAYMQDGVYDGERILKKQTVGEMLRTQTRLERGQGLGWFRDKVAGRTVWGHDGSDNGASSRMWFDPKSNEGVILVANGVWDDEEPLIATLFREADRH